LHTVRNAKGTLRTILRYGLFVGLCAAAAQAQVSTVSGRVEFATAPKKTRQRQPMPTAVVWLTPLTDSSDSTRALLSPDNHFRLVQKNKSFRPHLLVVPVGTAVEFPNHDPFFHNVFSLFEGRRFDLGLYEAGSTRVVHFDRPGISYIFCNIHPEMSAVVITLGTRLYAVSDSAGRVSIPEVPAGRYILHVWSEHALPESLDALTHEITINADASSLGSLKLAQSSDLTIAHKNKYGRDYDQPEPSNPVYPQQ
jgi:plastocyanin